MVPANVEMKQTSMGYFPKMFIANGIEYTVRDVVKCWLAGEKALGFKVRCDADNVLDLYHDVKNDAWTLTELWTY